MKNLLIVLVTFLGVQVSAYYPVTTYSCSYVKSGVCADFSAPWYNDKMDDVYNNLCNAWDREFNAYNICPSADKLISCKVEGYSPGMYRIFNYYSPIWSKAQAIDHCLTWGKVI